MASRQVKALSSFSMLGLILGIITLKSPSSLVTLLLTALLGSISLFIFITTRHIQLSHGSKHNVTVPSPPSYYLFVLGSGGHTKEMLMMMDDGRNTLNFHSMHRRYLISSGDGMSANHLHEHETELAALCASKGCQPGGYDVVHVTRGRRVHQALWTVPYSGLISMFDIVRILLFSPPKTSSAGTKPRVPGAKALGYPQYIFSNGPATGFFVGLVAYILRMFYVVPEDCMKLIYVESWARISTLSLTGRLIYYTGIAEVLVVQHEAVAVKYGIRNVGPLVLKSRRDDT